MRTLLVVALAFGGALGTALAQDTQDTQDTQDSQDAQNTQDTQQPATSAQEQLSQAQAIVTRGERLSAQVGAMKVQAEREKDIIRVTCLNTKLAEVNANLRNAKGRLDGLRNEVDPQRRMQALTVMIVLGQKFDVLDQEAAQCVGQNVFETGATKVESTIDQAVVPDDTEVAPSMVPDVVPPAQPGDVILTTPPTQQEASLNGDEVST